MRATLTRRELLAALSGGGALLRAKPLAGVLVESHLHLFAKDQQRFPYHPNATYKPPPAPLEDYVVFARQARIDHVVIVHPEPYQDDHSYLEHCFANEPSPAFFKGTCLFDPVAPETPARMEALVKRNPGRIVALRIHVNRKPGEPPTTSGAIRDRDLRAPAMKAAWRKARELGLAVQMHFIPCHAPDIDALAGEFSDMPVILDHLARSGQGTPAEYERALKMARLPRVWMKFSGVVYSSRQPPPHLDVKPLVRRTFDAFGPDRMIWGGLGKDMEEFRQRLAMFDELLSFASEGDRGKIRGENAVKLFGFK